MDPDHIDKPEDTEANGENGEKLSKSKQLEEIKASLEKMEQKPQQLSDIVDHLVPSKNDQGPRDKVRIAGARIKIPLA